MQLLHECHADLKALSSRPLPHIWDNGTSILFLFGKGDKLLLGSRREGFYFERTLQYWSGTDAGHSSCWSQHRVRKTSKWGSQIRDWAICKWNSMPTAYILGYLLSDNSQIEENFISGNKTVFFFRLLQFIALSFHTQVGLYSHTVYASYSLKPCYYFARDP